MSLLATDLPCSGEAQLTQDTTQLLHLTQGLELSCETVCSFSVICTAMDTLI